MTVAETIRKKLTEAFAPTRLEIVDESHMHAGHAGARPEGETHFRVEIASETFRGRSRVDRQRMIHDVLGEELAGPVHALSVSALPPET